MNKPHALMFHHFHDEFHVKGQGSIDESEFSSILEYYSKRFNLISADIFLKKFLSKNIGSCDVCITFDDNLKCQYDVALPVLNKLKLNAFWFVYTSPLSGDFEKLEIFRYFRSVYYNSFSEFYESFFKELESHKEYNYVFKKLENFNYKEYLKEFSFYTKKDRIFRHTRDNILGEEKYFEVMNLLIKKSKILLDSKLHKKLWMNSKHLNELNNNGHIIGLHSHTHPTRMGEKSFEFQKDNYTNNLVVLEKIINDKITCMSHPCNSYNQNTLEILNEMGVKLGFRANLTQEFYSNLEIPRIDHSEILKLI